MNCNTTHYRANSSSVPGDPTFAFLLPVPLTLALAVAMARPIFPRFFFFAIGFGLLISLRGATTIGMWLAERRRGMMTPQYGGMIMAAVLALGGITLSVRSLPYGYRFPKQDYGQAVAYVEASMKKSDHVVVIGEPAALPILTYMRKSWQRIDKLDQLLELRKKGDDVWAIYTFPSYIESSQPDLMTMLEKDCPELHEFDGTVAGGEIRVRQCPGISSD